MYEYAIAQTYNFLSIYFEINVDHMLKVCVWRYLLQDLCYRRKKEKSSFIGHRPLQRQQSHHQASSPGRGPRCLASG